MLIASAIHALWALPTLRLFLLLSGEHFSYGKIQPKLADKTVTGLPASEKKDKINSK
jgi:hypothetical protein